MDAPDTALRGQNTTADSCLYMAFELGEKNWNLSLGDGRRAPSHCTVTAGDTTAFLTSITNARVRCHPGAGAPVYSCYEAGRDGFWLHRWLTEQGIVNLVVDSASIEVNRLSRIGVKAPGMIAVMAPVGSGVERGFERPQGCGFLPDFATAISPFSGIGFGLRKLSPSMTMR